MDFRISSFSGFGALCLIFLLACCNHSHSEKLLKTQPNVILILTDDQGWGDLSINGNTNLNTPHIDQLAKNGVILDRFYVSPVCSPTRAEILTGRYSVRGGVYATSRGGERLDLDETTMAEIFQQAGYQTAAFGKWHSGMQYPYHPNGRGFDEFYGFCSGHWGNYIDPILEHNGQLVQGEGFLPDDLTNKAMEFIEKNKNQPFFLFLPFNTPHSPMQMPDEWWDKFADKELIQKGDGRAKETSEHTRAALAFCENIDWNVGRLIKRLKALDLEEETILVYLSDNGPNGARWNGDMKGRKGSTDEGGVRSPCFIQWKNQIPAGSKIEHVSAAIDLLPTLADLSGISWKTKKTVDGLSLKPLLLNPSSKWENRLIFNFWRGKLSVRSQQFRLDHEDQLFDMAADPGQWRDVAKDQPNVYQQLKKAKENWLEVISKELPEKDMRSFPIGHPDFSLTQIPARDGTPTGEIQRSNRWPNCSFFTNWINVSDKIQWEVEVLESGQYEVTLYYTAPKESIGSSFEVQFKDQKLGGSIEVAHDPPLTGMETDRFPRQESYIKNFRPLNIGTIFLEKGRGTLNLQALSIQGKQLMDFRLMMFKKI